MKNLINFHGCDHKVGTTMISQSVAEWIAGTRKELRILWIVCARGSGNEYADRIGESVEGLKGYLTNRVLKKEEVIESCRKTENFYMLGGVSSILEERYYSPEMTGYLLDCLRDEFDLIFADCGNDIDNGLSIGALQRGGVNILLTGQRESSLQRLDQLHQIYVRLKIEFNRVVVNFFREGDALSLDYIARRLKGRPQDCCSVRQSSYDRTAELEGKTLLFYRNSAFKEDIAHLSEWILQQYGMGEGEKRKRGRWKSFI